MGHRLNKKERIALRQKNKEKKIKRYESQDAKGISRKQFKLVIKPKTFFIMKAAAIVAFHILYFAYSPLLIFVMLYFVAMFFVAIGCEHSLNKSVIRSNHIKIPKYDSAIALVLICVALFGSAFSVSQGGMGMFANTLSMKVVQSLKNLGSLLTGQRSIFGRTPHFGFGTIGKPEGFIPNEDAFFDQFGGEPPEPPDFGERMPRFELSMDDIPIEFMFSQLLSTVTTVLIILVGLLGAISLYYTIKKIKKFNIMQSEVIIDGTIVMLEDKEIEAILDFGEIEEKFTSSLE